MQEKSGFLIPSTEIIEYNFIKDYFISGTKAKDDNVVLHKMDLNLNMDKEFILNVRFNYYYDD